MNVHIQDTRALAQIPVAHLHAYLRAHGWTSQEPWAGRPVTIYAKKHLGETIDLLTPATPLADYGRVVGEVVRTLSNTESRSQLDIFDDLQAANADTIRIISTTFHEDAPTPIKRAVGILTNAVRLLRTTARTAQQQPQRPDRRHQRTQVEDFLEGTRMSPHHGGSTLSIRSPAPPPNQDPGQEPFPRLAILQLARSLEELEQALTRCRNTQTLDPFLQAANRGVTPALCQAVSALSDHARGVRIEVLWAATNPAGVPDAHHLFPPDAGPDLAAAATAIQDDTRDP